MVEAILSVVSTVISLVLVGLVVVLFVKQSKMRTDIDSVKSANATPSSHTHPESTTVPTHTHQLSPIAIFDLKEFAQLNPDVKKAFVDNFTNGIFAKMIEALNKVISEDEEFKKTMIEHAKKVNDAVTTDMIYEQLKKGAAQVKAINQTPSTTTERFMNYSRVSKNFLKSLFM